MSHVKPYAANSILPNLAIVAFFTGLFSSTSILISHSFGAKDYSNVGISFHQGLWLALFSAPILMLIMWLCPIVLSKTHQNPNIIKMITPAFHALSWAILPRNLTTITRYLFMGINKAHLVTVMGAAIVSIQMFFTYAFLFGGLGFPKLELDSIGYAIAASYYIILIPLFLYLFYSKQFKQYELFKNIFKINTKILRELIRLGIPIGFMLITEIALFAAIAIMMGMLGADILAAYQIAYQYLTLAFVVGVALLRTIAIRVGIEVGENNRKALRFATLINIIIGPLLMLLFSIVYIYFPESIINLDIGTHSASSQELIVETSKFLFLVGILIIIDCIRLISTGALRGLKDIKIPFLIIFTSFWIVAIPCSYLLGFTFEFGGVGIWWRMIIGSLLSSSILPIRLNVISKRVKLNTLITKVQSNSG